MQRISEEIGILEKQQKKKKHFQKILTVLARNFSARSWQKRRASLAALASRAIIQIETEKKKQYKEKEEQIK